jgi:hypothetical protein
MRARGYLLNSIHMRLAGAGMAEESMPGARDRVRSEQSLLDTAEIQSKSSPMGSGGAPVAPSSDFGRRVVCVRCSHSLDRRMLEFSGSFTMASWARRRNPAT